MTSPLTSPLQVNGDILESSLRIHISLAQFFQNYLLLGPSWWPGCTFLSVTLLRVIWALRSPKVTRNIDEANTLRFNVFASSIIIYSNAIWPNFCHHVTLTSGQILTLSFQGHQVPACFDVSWWEKHNIVLIMYLEYWVQKLQAKNKTI